MLFNTYTFLFAFLPITLAGFAVGARIGRPWAIGWLVVCSLVYYGWWNPAYLGLIVASIVFNFAVGVRLSRSPSRSWLALGIAANLGALGYFKYAGFLVNAAAALTGSAWSIGDIVLPLAISFFTFQQIAYLVDAHRGLAAEYRFLDYVLFVVFFPQLIAGPIVHHGEMLPQFKNRPLGVGWRNLAIGGSIFAVGLFKKAVLADTFAELASPMFNGAARGAEPALADALAGTLAYTLQLYFDFSGYSEMAIGSARMFGILLPLNFNSPYKAVSITEFWRRWHITLSRFLRDYLYIPLGGNRRGRARRYVNLMATMLLGGLWHGAGWTFLFWGGLHGLYLCVNHAWSAARAKLLGDRRAGLLERLGYAALTFAAVAFAWVFFRAADFDTAGRVIGGLAGRHGLGSFSEKSAALIAVGLFIVWALPNTQQWFRRYRPALDARLNGAEPTALQRRFPRLRFRPTTVWALALAIALALSLICMTRTSEFIYYQF